MIGSDPSQDLLFYSELSSFRRHVSLTQILCHQRVGHVLREGAPFAASFFVTSASWPIAIFATQLAVLDTPCHIGLCATSIFGQVEPRLEPEVCSFLFVVSELHRMIDLWFLT